MGYIWDFNVSRAGPSSAVLRRGSAAACLLRLRVRIPPGACLSVVSVLCVVR
jgi:hypothetical protein